MDYHSPMLNTIFHGDNASATPLLIVHGLFGSGRNWGAIAKGLSAGRRVVCVDMRNHGSSFRSMDHSYEAMAGDLAEVIEAEMNGKADVLGHSMGGKAAMILALTRPELLRSLVVADIAPVAYSHSQQQYIDIMKSLDLDKLESRADARKALEPLVDEPTLAAFFTQSLDMTERRWKLGLDELTANMDKILGFPDVGTARYDGPALFLTGALSEYVAPEHRDPIKALFPQARFAKLSGAGHWLHAEKPREFTEVMRGWLASDHG